MGKTIAEKIISEHAGKEVSAGEFVVANVDLAYIHDGTGPLAVRQMKEMGLEKVYDTEKALVFLDHASPCPRQELANAHQMLREFASRTGATLYDVGRGICHQIVVESFASPGDLIVGADSHTTTAGGLGAFATGMGSTDVAVAMALGRTWLRVPETIRIQASGRFPPGVYSKDLILHIIGQIKAKGAVYKALEFTGEAVADMPLPERLTMANMAIEAGAKAGLFPTDDETRRFLEEMGRGEDFRPIASDDDARFQKTLKIDVSSLAPTLSVPHFVDNVKTIDEIGEVKVDQVFIGTCTNGRLKDFHIAKEMLEGRQVSPGTRLIIIPASQRIYLEGARDGTWEALATAGGLVNSPGCGPCVGVHQGVLADGDVCVSTQNRNFKGRMGNPNAFIYLASPAVAAATAIKGKIADPREFF
ncbi:MAG: 3-isopropylmalate dehydratase [Planctomycetes bacterium DG_23]|nr:MAG: 3-isopropylmalate dehydratase [Planctomycetes bacterium DG_23]